MSHPFTPDYTARQRSQLARLRDALALAVAKGRTVRAERIRRHIAAMGETAPVVKVKPRGGHRLRTVDFDPAEIAARAAEIRGRYAPKPEAASVPKPRRELHPLVAEGVREAVG